MTSNDDETVPIGRVKIKLPDDKLMHAYFEKKCSHLKSVLNQPSNDTKKKTVDFEKEKDGIVESYRLNSPDNISIEDDDGTFIPKKIPLPAAFFVPHAEPHVIITDVHNDSKDWYNIREYIAELESQAFACYYNGIYFASFICSVQCLESLIKYEIVRKNRDDSILENRSAGLGTMLKKLNDIGLSKWENELNLINRLRNGLFHSNTTMLRTAVIELKTRIFGNAKINIADEDTGEVTTEQMNKEFIENEYSMPNHTDFMRIAFFSYSVLNEVAQELYGESKYRDFIKAGIDDYEKRKKVQTN